jgi:hypothetical protein
MGMSKRGRCVRAISVPTLTRATRENDLAGDGTTTATVLAAAIIREGTKAVAAGLNPMDLKRGVPLIGEAIARIAKEESVLIKGRKWHVACLVKSAASITFAKAPSQAHTAAKDCCKVFMPCKRSTRHQLRLAAGRPGP